MNLAKVIKEEIFSKPAREKCCERAFLAGFLRGACSVFERDGEICFKVHMSSENASMVISEYLDLLYGYTVREVSVSEDRLNKKDKFYITVQGEDAINILTDLHIMQQSGDEYLVNLKMFGSINEKECCFKSFMKGLFCSVGHCVIPSDSDDKNVKFHLELVFSHAESASEMSIKLDSFDIPNRIIRRKDDYVLYIKSGESIKDFLAFISVKQAYFTVMDILIKRDAKNRANRRTNCEWSNGDKTVDCAQRQISAIKKLKQNGKLKLLKQQYILVANARVENPDLSLTELGEKLGITKSCLNHRLRKIVALSEE